MGRYANRTQVSAEKSRVEIESTLTRYGANGFYYGWEGEKAQLGFKLEGRMVKFVLTMPDREDEEFTLTSRGKERAESAAYASWEQATRQRWRALKLVILAKLEAIEAGISSFDKEFLAHIVLPNGATVSDWLVPQIDVAYETAEMPPMLPAVRTRMKRKRGSG